MNEFWFVYILRSQSREFRYIGSTNDIHRRFAEHNLGRVHSTKAYRPLDLEAFVAVKSERIARSLEIYFKTGSGKAVLMSRFLTPPDNEK
jgi:putative endonuclease